MELNTRDWKLKNDTLISVLEQSIEHPNNRNDGILRTNSNIVSDIVDPILGISSIVLAGLDDGFGGWSFAITVRTLTMSAGFVKNTVVKMWMLIIPIISFVGFLIASLLVKQYNKWETAIYLIFVSITCFLTGWQFYKKGKAPVDPKEYEPYDRVPYGTGYSKYMKGRRDINERDEFWEDIRGDFSGFLNDLTGPFIGNIFPLWNIVALVFDFKLARNSYEDWLESLEMLEGGSQFLYVFNPEWNE